MAIDINGYNDTFRAFADFANNMVDGRQGDRNSIARVTDGMKISGGALEGRTIVAAKTDSLRGVFKWFRAADEMSANNATREIFRNAVIDMFGGESKIPESVKKAMIYGDYDKGKPLTARRILAVKVAIDASHTTEARVSKLTLETFSSDEVKAEALKLGFTKAELPKLARAAHFYAQATGVSEMKAMSEVADPGSKANRLMQYGGRFMENAENFTDGLRLLDTFKDWFADLCDATIKINKTGGIDGERDFSMADTVSKHNSNTGSVKPETRLVMERFVFEEIANNPSANLAEMDGEAIFGFEHNDASRFIGRDLCNSCLNTIANIPPAKRTVVFKVFNLLCGLAKNDADHKVPLRDRIFTLGDNKPTLSRILRHLDEIIALDAKGKLDAKSFIKTCFPDMVAAKMAGNYDFLAIRNFLGYISAQLYLIPEEGGKYCDIDEALKIVMESTGCSLEEGAKSIRSGKPIPMPQYVSEGQQPITEFGTIAGGRKVLAADLDRPDNYSLVGENKNLLPKDMGFGFRFPGEGRFVANRANKDNIALVGDKVVSLCGRVHPQQASAVMLMLSQSALGALRGGLEPHGIKSSEHSAVDFTLSKDANTGAVTIKYSSPKGLPFRFSWTATVDIEGKTTSTPLKFEKPLGDISEADAKKTIKATVRNRGVELTDEGIALAMNLYVQHAKGMYPKQANVFANYLIGRMVSPLGGLQEGDMEAKAAILARDMKSWDDFGLGDPRLVNVGREIADIANDHIKEKFDDKDWFIENPGYQDLENGNAQRQSDISSQFWSDVPSGSWNINGKAIKFVNNMSVAEGKVFSKNVIDQFNKAVDDSIETEERRSVVKKVLSTLLHQGNFAEFELMGGKLSNLSNMKGAELFVSMSANDNPEPILSGSNKAMGLEISKDGKTAIVTVSIAKNITCDGSMSKDSKVGVALWAQKMTVDLTKDIPEVTNVTLSQQFDTAEVEITREQIDANLQISLV